MSGSYIRASKALNSVSSSFSARTASQSRRAEGVVPGRRAISVGEYLRAGRRGRMDDGQFAKVEGFLQRIDDGDAQVLGN